MPNTPVPHRPPSLGERLDASRPKHPPVDIAMRPKKTKPNVGGKINLAL